MECSLRMNLMRGLTLGFALFAAACGKEQSVASKSAAAYDEARAKGVEVGGGPDHGGHASTAAPAAAPAIAADHSAHATGTDPHSAMQHGTTTTDATDRSAPGPASVIDHAAMGHGTDAGRAMQGAATPRSHSAQGVDAAGAQHALHGATTAAQSDHGTATQTAGAQDQHAGMQHGSPSAAADPHAAHSQQPASATTHAQHGTQPAAAAQHSGMQHGAAPATAATPTAAPRTNQEMQRMQPSATLQPDEFDAAAATSVSEAARAAQGGGHDGHTMRGITPGEDRENPPSPMPATRGGAATKPADDHRQHGATEASVYTCPMHPEVTSDKPGTCPKCGMALVKK